VQLKKELLFPRWEEIKEMGRWRSINHGKSLKLAKVQHFMLVYF